MGSARGQALATNFGNYERRSRVHPTALHCRHVSLLADAGVLSAVVSRHPLPPLLPLSGSTHATSIYSARGVLLLSMTAMVSQRRQRIAHPDHSWIQTQRCENKIRMWSQCQRGHCLGKTFTVHGHSRREQVLAGPVVYSSPEKHRNLGRRRSSWSAWQLQSSYSVASSSLTCGTLSAQLLSTISAQLVCGAPPAGYVASLSTAGAEFIANRCFLLTRRPLEHSCPLRLATWPDASEILWHIGCGTFMGLNVETSALACFISGGTRGANES